MPFKLYRYFALGLLLISQMSLALDPVFSSRFSSVAIRGYDPVAYFTEGAAFKGKKEFQYEWKGAKWNFTSEENMNKFALSPESYEPQFGGYCSYAVGLGQTASSDPTQFTVTGGKLYLNFSSKTKILWEDDREKFIEQAHENWPKLLNK